MYSKKHNERFVIMKKIFTLLLCIALLGSMLMLVSCDKDKDDDEKYSDTLNGKTPEELYEFSQVQLKEAKSYSVATSQEIEMDIEGEKINIVQRIDSKVNGDNTYMNMVSENDMYPSGNITMESWYVDGVCYAKSGSEKVKATISKAEYMEKYMEADPSESTLLDIPESWFEDVKFEKKGDYNILKFVVSGEKYTALFGNIGLNGAEIDGDVEYRIYFDDDGNLTKLVAEFDMNVMGYTAHCESVSLITIGDVTVTPPSDADKYQEVVL